MRSLRVLVGLYGALFHMVVAVVVAWAGYRHRAEIPASFWLQAVPPFVVAAFAIYAFVVAPYVPRRGTGKGTFLFDSAVAMFAETAVFVLTAVLYAAVASAPAVSDGIAAYASAAATTALYAVLWSFGSFFLQILVVGNAAGLVGWWILKRIDARRAAA